MTKNTNPVSLDLKKQANRILLLMTFSFIFMFAGTLQASDALPIPQATLTGKITDAFTGKPIAGVTITVKGTKTTTLSTKDGSYSLVLPKNAKALVFTLSGYQPLEVAISGRTAITVEMSVVEIDPSLW